MAVAEPVPDSHRCDHKDKISLGGKVSLNWENSVAQTSFQCLVAESKRKAKYELHYQLV